MAPSPVNKIEYEIFSLAAKSICPLPPVNEYGSSQIKVCTERHSDLVALGRVQAALFF